MWPCKVLLTLVSLCGAIGLLEGQSNDWRSVENLAPGTSLSVVIRARLGCDFVSATNSELTCDRTIAGQTRTYVLERVKIREVRLEFPEHNSWLRGALVGAAVGGLVGLLAGSQSGDPETRGYLRLYGLPIGAVGGGAIGHAIHGHGPVVYRR